VCCAIVGHCFGGPPVKKAAFAIAAIASLFGRSALAADMAVKSPLAQPLQAYGWTGFYVGGDVGYAWATGTDSITDPDGGGIGFPPGFGVLALTNQNRDSAIGGGLIGFNYQFAPTWVIGLEGDWSWTDLQRGGSITGLSNGVIAVPTGFASAEVSNKDISSVRGRLGYAFGDWLTYVTGGAAFAKFNYSGDFGCSLGLPCTLPVHAPISFSKNVSGAVLGAGVEHKFANTPWSFGVEYLYYHFGGSANMNALVVNAAGNPEGFNTCGCETYSFGSQDVSSIRARLTYQFGWPAAK
jgi:outer membrane immunogenic protein